MRKKNLSDTERPTTSTPAEGVLLAARRSRALSRLPRDLVGPALKTGATLRRLSWVHELWAGGSPRYGSCLNRWAPTSMNPDHVIDALHGRRTGADRFVFPCPLRKSKSRSSGKGRVLADRILIKDFDGCPTAEVLRAAGLSFNDLSEGAPPRTTLERNELARLR